MLVLTRPCAPGLDVTLHLVQLYNTCLDILLLFPKSFSQQAHEVRMHLKIHMPFPKLLRLECFCDENLTFVCAVKKNDTDLED